MPVKTFPFEVPTIHTPPQIITVDARPSAHPLLVIHEAILEDRKRKTWVITHGPSGRAWARHDRLADCVRHAAIVARLDPDGSVLAFNCSDETSPVVKAADLPPEVVAIARRAREIFNSQGAN